MGMKIKKEQKPQQKLTLLRVKYFAVVPLLGIAEIATLMNFYWKMPAEGMLAVKLFYIIFSAVGLGFAYWGFMWKLTSDQKGITLRPAFGSEKKVLYHELKGIEVHKKKRNNSLSYYVLLGNDGKEIVKIYPIMNNSGELLTRLDRLGIKITELTDR